MRRLFILLTLAVFLLYCSDKKGGTATGQTFCDTACKPDTFMFTGKHKMNPYVAISVKNCTGDTVTWSHDYTPSALQMHLGTLLGNLVRLNKEALSCYIKDTSYAWLTFNDCMTGRGYLLYLPYSKQESVRKISSAVNSFDKKFVLPEDIRAYCDYSTIYVEDIGSGKKAQMTFKEEYKIDWNNIHETIDSINISRNRIFVQLLKNGQKVPVEKNISL